MTYMYLRGSQFWMTVETDFVKSETKIAAYDGDIWASQGVWNYLVLEIWIIIGVGNDPYAQVRK